MATPVSNNKAPAASSSSSAGGIGGISANTQAAVQGMQQLTQDGMALQMADLQMQTTIQPIKKLAGAAKDALS